MGDKTHTQIELAISRRKAGEIVFPADFRGKGTQAAIKKTMSRLARTGKVRRLGHGIYYIPKTDPVLGELQPDVDEVVKMLAQKERIRVRPAGAYALHRLGLTTQVPMKRVYITDGSRRQFRLGKTQIRFKATSPKKLSTKGKISSLVIQAIEEIGVDYISHDLELKLKEFLLKEDPRKFKQDLSLTSVKVNDYIVKLLKKDFSQQ
jgi:hypothetical protein